MISKETKILIVGLGLIGCSYAMALSRRGYQVSAIDSDYRALQYGLEKGFIKTGFTKPNENAFKDQEIIILGLYPSAIIDWINENQQYIKSGALITDTTGLKSPYLFEIKNILRKDLEYVAHNPIVVSEYSGALNSDDSLFEGANFIVTPLENNTEEAIETIKELGEILGFENIVELNPKKHDELITYLNQMTHVIALALISSKEDTTGYTNYADKSFKDLIRLASSNETLWTELFLSNKDYLVKEIDSFVKQMQLIKKVLLNDDKEFVEKIMTLAKEKHDDFDDF